MTRAIETVDILVAGAGLAGLAAANLLAQAGFSVICLDRKRPAADPGADERSTALLDGSVETLRRAGVWEALAPDATELAAMRIIDAGGPETKPRWRVETGFDAVEIDRPAFGWNLSNGALARALTSALEARGNAELRAPADIVHLLPREDAALATLADGARLRARLLVGADGRESMVRARIGVGVRRVAYDQRALAFTVAHDRPHGNVSVEIHRTAGPFVLAPFSDAPDGAHRSAVVWVERAAQAQKLLAMDPDAFALAATERSLGVFGPLRLASARMAWPCVSLLADRFHGRRTALMAEAAHVAPPIGAQGLNMSLADAQALCDLLVEARAAGRDIGEPKLLERYTGKRWPDAAARVAATAALNTAAIGAATPVRLARRAGLATLGRIGPLKRAVMRFGQGG